MKILKEISVPCVHWQQLVSFFFYPVYIRSILTMRLKPSLWRTWKTPASPVSTWPGARSTPWWRKTATPASSSPPSARSSATSWQVSFLPWSWTSTHKHTKKPFVVQAESYPHSTEILTGWVTGWSSGTNNLRKSWPQRAEHGYVRSLRILTVESESTRAPGVTGKVNWGVLTMFPAGTGHCRAQGQSESHSAHLRIEQQCLFQRDQSPFLIYSELLGSLPPIYCCSWMMNLVFILILFMCLKMWFF